MEELPLEIWFLIIEYFSEEDLYSFIGVNRFFFNIGLDKRYREISLDLGEVHIRKLLDRISEPQIASRIKKLNLHVHPTNAPRPVRNTGATPNKNRWLNPIRGAIKAVMGRIAAPQDQGPLDVDGMVAKLFILIPLMTTLEDLRIVPWALPPTFDLDRLFEFIWETCGHKLHRVSLCANLPRYRSLLKAKPAFPLLETLELEFSDNLFVLDPTEGDVLANDVLPFFNRLAPQVKTLKIRSFSKLDLSPLFAEAEPFTSLHTTLIRIPFNHGLRGNPAGLKEFLVRSNTLRKVTIRLTPMGLALDPAAEEPLCSWFKDCVSSPICFSKVDTLDICPTNQPGGISLLHDCVSRTFNNLTRFTVRDRYLKVEEAVSLAGALKACPRLTAFRLNILQLSGATYDAFARDLPQLRFLWMSVGEPASTEPSSSTSLETFRNYMSQRTYNDWNLWDLTIWQGGNEMDYETMLACARSIPSLRSFWGNGHMDFAPETRAPTLRPAQPI